jgi:hypothetical protein
VIDRAGEQPMAHSLAAQPGQQEEAADGPDRRIMRLALFQRPRNGARRVELRHVVAWPDLHPGDRLATGITEDARRRPCLDPLLHMRLALVGRHFRPHRMRQTQRHTPAMVESALRPEQGFEVTPAFRRHRLETNIVIQRQSSRRS